MNYKLNNPLPKALLIVFLAFLSFNSVKAQESGLTDEVVISEDLMNYFKKSVLKRVKRLEHYISMIADKEIEDKLRRDAIDQTIELFESNNNVVQVSYIRNGETQVKDYPVRTYFDRLYAIKAEKVDITFYEVTQLTDIRRGMDDKFYATAFIFQDTKIYYDSESDVPDYQDKTTKAIDVIIKPDTVTMGDKAVVLYPAKLGNINVKETR